MGDENVHSGNTASSFSNNVYMADENSEFMRWLSPLEPNIRHQDVRAHRFDGIGNWLLETEEFREWRRGAGGADNAVLFCSGNPGVGKTYLSSLVIDSLCDQEGKEDIVVAGLYCDYLSQQDQSATNMMGAILKQLVGKKDIQEHIHDAHRREKGLIDGRGPQLADLVGMFRVAIASLPQVFICIDALDEFLPKYLSELLGSLGGIVRESPKTRIFLTGRPHVTEDIERYFTKVAVVPVYPSTDDFRSYLEMRLGRDTGPEAMNDGLRADILRIILNNTYGIFLLVSLHIGAILAEVTIRRRRKRLEEIKLGNGLGDAYTATLTRLKAQKRDKSILGLKVLMWVLYSERPLKVEELRHALGVELRSTNLDRENVPALRTLLASSLGLVTVEASSSTVRLVHVTLQEHLLSDSALFHSPHSTIAETCLTYLNFQLVRDALPWIRTTMPLLEYASSCWVEHAKNGMTKNVKMLALQLLARFDGRSPAPTIVKELRKPARFFDIESKLIGRGFSGLHVAAFHGIVEVVTPLLEMKKWDVNARDSASCTPLMWAALRGHEEVVKMLLEQGDVSLDLEDHHYGLTALHWAAKRGHEGVLKVFLQREGVNPERASTQSSPTPIYLAADSGHEGIVEVLLGRGDVNPNRPSGRYGMTPLSRAAYNGCEGVVKMLLEREDVNPNLADADTRRTPLSNAAERGHEEIVRMLLERNDVLIDTQDFWNETPVSLALSEGHREVARMISEWAGIELDDTDPGSPLSLLSSPWEEE